MELITLDDRYTRKTNIQDLMDLTIDELFEIFVLEYSKCVSADSFLLFEEFFFREDFEYISTKIDSLDFSKHSKTKIYLVKLLQVLLKEKYRLLKTISHLNLYENYLFYVNHHADYLTAHSERIRRLNESYVRKKNIRISHLRIVV